LPGLSSSHRRQTPEEREALDFIERSGFPWHQGWELVSGLRTPGRSTVGVLLERIELTRLESLTVLDVGT